MSILITKCGVLNKLLLYIFFVFSPCFHVHHVGPVSGSVCLQMNQYFVGKCIHECFVLLGRINDILIRKSYRNYYATIYYNMGSMGQPRGTDSNFLH